jgi:hypothetical protein
MGAAGVERSSRQRDKRGQLRLRAKSIGCCPELSGSESARTKSLPAELAVCFGVISGRPPYYPQRHREQYAKRVSTWLADWVPAYVRSVFASEKSHWSPLAWRALEEDGIQHVLLAAIRRGPERWARTSDEHALWWTKKVVKNFVVSEGVRRRCQQGDIEIALRCSAGPFDAPRDAEIAIRKSLIEATKLLRQELCLLARPRDVALVLRSFDELMAFALGFHDEGDGLVCARGSDRARQRRMRARRLAEAALRRLAKRKTPEAGLDRLAALVGLGHAKKLSQASRGGL